jgi:bacterioferritin
MMLRSDDPRQIDHTTSLTDDRENLVRHLNSDLAGELQAIIMYIQYSAILRGLHRNELRRLFQSEIPDEIRHATLLADKIAVFGGIPTTLPRPVPRAVGAYQILRNVLEVEIRAIADYAERSTEAAANGELALKVELENLIVDETRHRDEVERILAGWSQNGIDGRP